MGNFKFGSLPKGSYVLSVEGALRAYPSVVVTKTSGTCGRPLLLLSNLTQECSNSVETKLPRWVREFWDPGVGSGVQPNRDED